MIRTAALLALALCSLASRADAFCGFYVAQADADLFNNSSKVAIARKGDRTVVTMANDYVGEPSDFAIVIPVPVAITREQVHVPEPGALQRLDAFSAPRLAEYYDPNPCQPPIAYMQRSFGDAESLEQIVVTGSRIQEQAYGVTIEDSYTAGEYDILILSAEQSDGLQRWLTDNGYKLPEGAERILGSYIKQEMKFFVAKVNLAEKASSGGDYLRPISIAYEDENFMLPIRLGTLNADGSQDLIVFALSSEGRVETSNYRTRKIPTNEDVPLFIKEETDAFGDFYKAMFEHTVKKRGGSGVFMEYFWTVGNCDPCAGDPPPVSDLLELGVHWLPEEEGYETVPTFEEVWAETGESLEDMRYIEEEQYWGDSVYLTRLHVRYDARSFPQDLEFQETGDTEFFQGRYVINVPWRGEATCPEAEEYIGEVAVRQKKEFATLTKLTGWRPSEIRARAEANGDLPFTTAPKPPRDEPSGEEAEARDFYDRLFWWGAVWKAPAGADDQSTESGDEGDE